MTAMKKHHDCHCGLHNQIKKFKAGKLGLLGGILIVGHLLFHVAECLILPVIFVGFTSHSHGGSHEAVASDLIETTFSESYCTGVFINPREFIIYPAYDSDYLFSVKTFSLSSSATR